jgi:hypothetical protein
MAQIAQAVKDKKLCDDCPLMCHFSAMDEEARCNLGYEIKSFFDGQNSYLISINCELNVIEYGRKEFKPQTQKII